MSFSKPDSADAGRVSEQNLVPTVPKKTELFKNQGLAMIQKANAIVVNSQASYDSGVESVRLFKELRKAIEDEFREPKAAAHKAHKEISGLETRLLEGPKQAENIVRMKLGNWLNAERVKAEEAKRQAEEKLRKEAEEQKERDFEAACEGGDIGRAEEIRQAEVKVPEVVAPEPPKKSAGASWRPVLKFRIVDKSKIKPEFMVPDETKIRKYVSGMGKGAEDYVGGIEVYEEAQVNVRG